jgi:hypothetical protein
LPPSRKSAPDAEQDECRESHRDVGADSAEPPLDSVRIDKANVNGGRGDDGGEQDHRHEVQLLGDACAPGPSETEADHDRDRTRPGRERQHQRIKRHAAIVGHLELRRFAAQLQLPRRNRPMHRVPSPLNVTAPSVAG